MTNDLRVGLVGVNAEYGWGKTAHVPAIEAAPGVVLHGVAGRSKEGAEKAAKAFNARIAFESPEETASSPEIDVIAVAVRAPAHREVVLAALERGKPVYCEWPLGVNLAEAEEMASAAAAAGVLTAVGLQGRHSPWLIHVRNSIASGLIGRVASANLLADDDMPYDAWAQSNAYMLESKAGANALTIQGGHFLDSLAFVIGEFASIRGLTGKSRDTVTIKETGVSAPMDVPDQVAVAMQTEDGAIVGAQLIGGKTPGPAMTLLVQGTEGVLRATSAGYMHWRVVEVAVAKKGSDAFEPVPTPDSVFTLPRADKPGPDYTLAHSYAAFADAIRSDNRFRADFDDAVLRHRMIDLILNRE